jgi:hypothetical protein
MSPTPAGLAGAQAPPFLLPGEHFTAALIFLFLGALGLIRVAPDLAHGLFPLPRVAGVTHLFTLGWITTSILGALYQFLPVALGVPIRSVRWAHISFWLYAPGLVLFVGGLLMHQPAVMIAGGGLFGAGLLIFVVNLGATLLVAPHRGLTWWTLVGAALSLAATIVIGLTLAGNLHRGFLGPHRFLALGVHLHLALAGWVFLVVIGVAHRLLPMFLLSHGAPEWPGRVAAALTGGGALGLMLLHHFIPLTAIYIPGLLIGAGALAFAWQARLYFRHRVKRALDPGLRLAGVAVGFMALGVALAPFALGQGLAAPRLMVAYVATLVVGGFGLFVVAHYYKIVPFLVWYHRFGPLAGKQPVPRVAELYSARVARVAAALLTLGALGLIAAILAGMPGWARGAALIYSGGTGIVVFQIFRISQRRPA